MQFFRMFFHNFSKLLIMFHPLFVFLSFNCLQQQNANISHFRYYILTNDKQKFTKRSYHCALASFEKLRWSHNCVFSGLMQLMAMTISSIHSRYKQSKKLKTLSNATQHTEIE